MSTETNLDDVYEQLDAQYAELDTLYEEYDALWTTLYESSEDTDGDGIVDIDESSEEYQQILALEEKLDALFEKLDASYAQLDELLGDDDGAVSVDNPDTTIGIGMTILDGTDEDDTLEGTDGLDNIFGGGGDDVLSGGAGWDFLDGGAGDDTMSGGAEEDWFLMQGGGDDVIEDFNPGEDMLDFVGTGVAFADIQSEATEAGLQLSWDGGSLLLKGVTDELSSDWVMTEDDLMIMEPIVDPDFGGDFDGDLDGGFGGDSSDGDIALIEPSDDDDLVFIQPIGDPIVDPGFGPDFAINIVQGTDENDTLTGTDGMDDLFGGAGDDVLNGGAEWDYLIGEGGNDTLTGGADMDTFFFGEDTGNDVITDFTEGEDYIDLVAAGVTMDDLSITQEDGDTLVSWGDNSVLLKGFTGTLDEGSLILRGSYIEEPISIDF